MKFNKNLLKEKWFSYTIALCSAVVLYLLLTHMGGFLEALKSLWHVGAPVFMAFVIAYVLGPLVNLYSKYVLYKLEQEKLRHTLSVLLAILSVVLSIVILVVALVPQVIDSVVMFAGNLNGYVLSFQRLMRQLNTFARQHDLDLSQFISSSDELLQSITRILPENINKIVNVSYSFGSKMFEWVISFILAIYLMLDQKKLHDGFSRLLHAILPLNVYRNTSTFWSRCNRILIQYIAFDVLDGLIIGLCNWVFMVIMNMPYVAIISVIVGITNLAPTFGPMAGAILGSFILVLVKPMYALLFLIFTLILQTLDGYVIKPRLFGEQLGVSSVWILIALIVGGRMLGVVGILLAIPFAAIGDFVYHDYFIKWLEEQNPDHKKIKAAAAAGVKAAGSVIADAASDLAGDIGEEVAPDSDSDPDSGSDSGSDFDSNSDSGPDLDSGSGSDSGSDFDSNLDSGPDLDSGSGSDSKEASGEGRAVPASQGSLAAGGDADAETAGEVHGDGAVSAGQGSTEYVGNDNADAGAPGEVHGDSAGSTGEGSTEYVGDDNADAGAPGEVHGDCAVSADEGSLEAVDGKTGDEAVCGSQS